MKTELQYFNLHGGDRATAEWAAEQSHGQFSQNEKVRPVEPDDIYGYYAGVAAMQGTAIIGYVGAKQPIWMEADGHSLSQISTLIVPAEHRGQGVAGQLVRAITLVVAAEWYRPFALASACSRPSFRAAGYVDLAPSKLPPGVTSAFGNPAMVYDGPLGNDY